MTPPGRRRKFDPTIPAHIDQGALPKGLYWDRSGSGRWYVLEAADGKRKAKTIATASARLSELHAILEARRAGDDHGTLNCLLQQFSESGRASELSERTRADYEKYRRYVKSLPTGMGKPLGELIVARLTLPFMQRFFDGIAAKHPTKANHLLRYLRRVFAWGMRRGLCAANPCSGAEQAREAKSRPLPDLLTLSAVTAFARERGQLQAHTAGSCAPYLWIMIELAYLCRLRPVEVITLTDANATPAGIETNRRKGSRDNQVEWSPRLRSAWDAALQLRKEALERHSRPTQLRAEARPLIVAQDGAALKRSSLDSAWQRLMRSAVAAGVIADEQRFGMHAMKHRGITDTPGTRHDKQSASGHRSERMMDVYDHSLPMVKPSADG